MPLHALARAGLAVTLLLGLVGTAHALTLKSEEFKTHRRPAVTFDHDNHNERAKIEDCIVCHHGGENGVIDPEVSSEDQPLFECHKANMPSGRTPLMRAYHRTASNAIRPRTRADHSRRLPQ
ncbi:MAG: cytochrome c3 family protein [Bilophila wadsworthia]